MTYPPQQPPYPPQQPPYPPYPPQQPQQHGWGQPPSGYPMGGPMGPPMGGGLPPRPPSKRPLILSLAGVVVLALVVVFVGGFAWPGWFTGGSSSSGSHQMTQNDARQAAQRFVDAINSQDATTLGGLACPAADKSVQNTITKVTQYHVKATLGDISDFSSDPDGMADFQAKADVTVQGQTESYTSDWSTTGYQFCVASIMDDGASGGS